MFKKYIFVFAFILIFVSCMCSVVATDNIINCTDDNIVSDANDVDVMEDDVNTNTSYTLSDLDADIQNTDKYILQLKNNYTYNEDTDSVYTVKDWPKGYNLDLNDLTLLENRKNSGINITKDIILDGAQINNFDNLADTTKTIIDCKSKCHLFNVYNSHVILKDIEFINVNYYLSKNEYNFGYEKYGFGGAIHAENSTVEIFNCIFKMCDARKGGAIYGKDCNISITNSVFSDCSAHVGRGGGLLVDSGFTRLYNCTFQHNGALYGGGAVYVKGSSMISYCDFISNIITGTNGSGGALYVNDANISYCNFTSGYSSHIGGAVFVIDSNVSNCIFKYNGVHDNGGALYGYGDEVRIVSSLFEVNGADNGGALYFDSKNIVLDSNVFIDNHANYNGSDVYCKVNNDTNVIVRNCTVYPLNVSESFIGVNASDFNIIYSGDENNVTVNNNTYNNTIVEPKKDTPNNTKTTTNNNIIKLTPVLTAKKATFKVKKAIKKYTVTLKVKNKPLKNIKLTLKIKGKTYTSTTNKKGKAVFKIRNLKKKGTYKATVMFKGDKHYNKITKTIKIKCK